LEPLGVPQLYAEHSTKIKNWNDFAAYAIQGVIEGGGLDLNDYIPGPDVRDIILKKIFRMPFAGAKDWQELVKCLPVVQSIVQRGYQPTSTISILRGDDKLQPSFDAVKTFIMHGQGDFLWALAAILFKLDHKKACLAMIGESNVGKSALAKLVNLIVPGESGEVHGNILTSGPPLLQHPCRPAMLTMNEFQWSTVVGPMGGHMKELLEGSGTKIKGQLYQPLEHRFRDVAVILTSNHMISSEDESF